MSASPTSPITILTTEPLNMMFPDNLAAMLMQEHQFKIYDGSHSPSHIHDVLTSEKIDLVIALANNGVHSIQRIRKMIRNGKGQKVIIMGDLTSEVIFEYIKVGIKGYLDNSISADLLKTALEVVHNNEVWFDRKTSTKVLELFAKHDAEKRKNNKIHLLSKREKEVLECVSRGLKNSEIASTLFICESTVKAHLYSIYDKLGVNDRLAAALLMRES